MKVAEQIGALYENEWTDAYIDIEKQVGSEKVAVAVLFETLMTSYNKSKENMELSADDKVALVRKDLKGKFKEVDFDARLSKKYLEKCCDVCTKMLRQEVPMSFGEITSKGDDLDPTLYKPYTRQGNKIDYIVWPPLFLTEGGCYDGKRSCPTIIKLG